MPKRSSQLEEILIDGEVKVFKTCSKCSEIKELNEFHKEKHGLGGRRSDCKNCNLARTKKWEQGNSDKLKAYRINNKEKLRIYFKNRYESNKEKFKADRRSRYERDKAAELQRSKDYYYRNRDTELERMRKYYHLNKDDINKKRVIWNKENREILRAQSLRRRAKIKALPYKLDSTEIDEIMSLFNHRCALSLEEHPQLDHFIALNTGHGGTSRQNLIPISKNLNSSKNSKNPFNWVIKNETVDIDNFNRVVQYLADENGLSIDEYRQFVDWCYFNKRDVTSIGRQEVTDSLLLWKEAQKDE